MKVQVARKEELGEIVAFLMTEPFKMSGWPLKDFEPDLDKVSSVVLDSYINGQIFYVRSKLGKIEGCILLVEESPWWNSSKSAIMDRAFIVVDNPTTQNVAKSLLLASKAYAKIKGLKLLIQMYTTDKNSLKERFFDMNGFELIGFSTQSK